MSKYNWDINLIRNKITTFDNYIKILTEELDKAIENKQLNKIKKYQSYIDSATSINDFLYDIIKASYPDRFKEEDDSGTILEKYRDSFCELQDIDQITKEVAINVINNIVGLIPDYFEKRENLLNFKSRDYLYLTEDDLTTLAHDFYKSYYPNALENIDKYLNPDNKMLNFQYSKNCGRGLTFTIKHQNLDCFFIVYRDNTFNDILTLVHELAHMYGARDKNKLPAKKGFNPIAEVEGRLAEYSFLEYAKDNNLITTDIINHFDDVNVFETINAASYILFCIILNKTSDKDIRKDKVEKSLIHYGANIKPDNILYDFYSDFSCDESIRNIISDLSAYDLVKIYKDDPEFVRRVLDNLGSTKLKPNLNDTLDDIGATFHKDNCATIKRKIKEYKRRSL